MIIAKNPKVLVTAILALVVAGVFFGPAHKAAAACAANTANMGSVTGSFTVPANGTYRVWSRIMPDATTNGNNSYTLEIDGNTCNVTVGDATIAANTWTWVDYQSGNTATKTNVTLTAGTHTYAMYGRESGVQVDRVIFAADSSCTPTGTGDNCITVTDTTKPTVSITSPAANATLTGASNTIQATAADDTAVAKVEFFIDGSTAVGTADTSSPYSATLNTTGFTNGPHILTAKATDTAGNTQTSAGLNITISNTVADTVPPTISITAPAANATISGTSTAFTADAADNVAVNKVDFYIDGNLLGTDTTSPYSFTMNTTLYTNGAHNLTAKATDTSNLSLTTAARSVTINNVDTTAPSVTITAPTVGATVTGTINLNANVSDAVGVTKVEFVVDGSVKNTDTASPYTFALDTTPYTNATHTITVNGYDAAGNKGTAAVTVTVNNTIASGTIRTDFNGDGHTGIADLNTLLINYGKTVAAYGPGDTNGDGKCNIQDLVNVINRYGN